ncbi:winged helix-turn-helix domain-containing protein [Streptomyces sp. NPDC079020]|uniref:winged helix-turn-helix domain-containing protein n=1 Tax=Streptomyces sp. NPDC079020 TaxID=3365722 RepID=UPI0037D7A805
MEAELAKASASHGWEDQRWTLSRVKTVIGRRFHLTYTIQGVRKLRRLVDEGLEDTVAPSPTPGQGSPSFPKGSSAIHGRGRAHRPRPPKTQPGARPDRCASRRSSRYQPKWR